MAGNWWRTVRLRSIRSCYRRERSARAEQTLEAMAQARCMARQARIALARENTRRRGRPLSAAAPADPRSRRCLGDAGPPDPGVLRLTVGAPTRRTIPAERSLVQGQR